MAQKLNNDKPLGSLEMGVLYTKLPENIKKEIVTPYISIKESEARISVRIKDSNENLRRNELINQIKFDLKNKLNLTQEEFKLAGVLIIFNFQKLSITFFPRPSISNASFETMCFNFSFAIKLHS